MHKQEPSAPLLPDYESYPITIQEAYPVPNDNEAAYSNSPSTSQPNNEQTHLVPPLHPHPNAYNHPPHTRTTIRTILIESDDDLNSLPSLIMFFLNVAWLFSGGIIVSIVYFILGLILCVSIIGIPCGLQLFKLGQLSLFPFGSAITRHRELRSRDAEDCYCCCTSFLLNILWLPIGVVVVLIHVLCGVAAAVTIVGIPFAYVHFKLAMLALCPFGDSVACGAGRREETVVTTTTTSYCDGRVGSNYNEYV